MNNREILQAVKDEMALISDDMKKLALKIWENPETAWNEVESSKFVCQFLEDNAIPIERGICGIPTAFRGEVGNGPGAVFAFAAEYDALPIGHACGHNLIAAASSGAVCAASRVAKKLGIPGKLVILGTPAEEAGNAKVSMTEKGVLNGIDAVMMAHPGWCTIPDRGSLAIRRYDVTFHGKSSHSAGSPELGINALDAVMLLFSGVSFFRQQMPEFCRIHGIVREGGKAPNIIPADASCRFYLRSAKEEWMEKLDQRFDEMVRGAALMTGCSYDKEKLSVDCKSRKPDSFLNELYVEAMQEQGETISPIPASGRASSDFGNFSHVIPAAHPYFAISDTRIGAHSAEFKECARSAKGLENMVKAAIALAYTACCFMVSKNTLR